MNLLSLRYFADIAESGSITRAAEKNHITQQSMSGQLKKLEEEHGTALFVRGARMELTESGRILYDAARSMLSIYADARRKIDACRKEERPLVIGSVYNDAPPFLPDLLSKFYEKGFRSVGVQLVQNCFSVIRTDLDIVFALECPDSAFAAMPLLKDRLAVVVSDTLLRKTFAERTDEIIRYVTETKDTEPLTGLPFARVSMPDSADIDFGAIRLKEPLDDPFIQVGSGDFVFSLCRSGQAATVCTEDYARHMLRPGDELRIFPLTDDISVPSLSLFYRRGSEKSRAVAAFIRVTKQYFGMQAGTL